MSKHKNQESGAVTEHQTGSEMQQEDTGAQAQTGAVTEEGAVTEQAATAATEASASGKDGSKVLLKDGTPRIDFIRKRWAEKASRAQITKEINERRIDGSPVVPYQIVFSATKGKPGGPDAPAAAEQAEAAAAGAPTGAGAGEGEAAAA